MTNIFGLDTNYLQEKLSLLLERMYNHTPEEAARVLLRLALVASEKAVWEEMNLNYDNLLNGETNE